MSVAAGVKLTVTLLGSVLAAGALAVGVARADEFELGIVLGENVDEAQFAAGFQLAVDESPDVSHPPGAEGGNHLGSIDVSFTVAALGSGDILVNELVEAAPPILVVDASSGELNTIVARFGSIDGLLVAFTESGLSDLQSVPGLVVVSREQAEAAALLLSPTFETDFAAAYGGAPSSAAARGYAAGKLVDLAVEGTDRNPTDVGTLSVAVAAAVGVDVAAVVTESPVVDLVSVADGTRSSWPTLIGAVVIAGALLLALAFVWRRQAGRDVFEPTEPRRQGR